MGVVAFKDLGSSATKFAQNGQSAAPSYAKNAAAAGATWLSQTEASNQNWKDGINAAVGRDAFSKGVSKAGSSAYTNQVTAVGQTRFSDGMSKAGPKWQKNFGAIAQAVAGKDLGPRGITGSAQNKQRAAAMSDAWRAAKLAAAG